MIIRVQNQSDISAVSQRISPKKHPNLRSWRVIIIRSKGEYLGSVAPWVFTSMPNSVDQSPAKGAVSLANRTPNHVSRSEQAGTFALALSRVTEIGEQAVAAVAASLARGGPVIKGQLIASRFYEAMQRELKQLPMDAPKRAALISASDRCERIATARINPTALLDELRKAAAVLTDDQLSEPAPIKGRPVLRLIEGGLST